MVDSLFIFFFHKFTIIKGLQQLLEEEMFSDKGETEKLKGFSPY